MKRYFLRSLKYFLTLCVLLVALIWLKITYEQLPVTFAQMLEIYFSAWNGWAMAAVIVLLSATYPHFGFVTRKVDGSIVKNRQQILAAMDSVGLAPASESANSITFRATGLQRLTLLFEDEVIVSEQQGVLTISGHRRTVVRAVIRLEGYIVNNNRVNNE